MVEPINYDDLDGERSGGGAGTIAGTMPRSSMFSFLAAGGKLFALEPSVHALADPCVIDHKDAEQDGVC